MGGKRVRREVPHPPPKKHADTRDANKAEVDTEETDREFVLSRGHAFSPVPDEFAKWADEVAVEKDVIADAFEAAHAIDPHSTEEVPAREILMQVRAKNTELKINDQMLGGFMKRKFIDTKDISVRKKRTMHAMVWTGSDCSTYDRL